MIRLTLSTLWQAFSKAKTPSVKNLTTWLCVALLSATLAACSGGGGGDATAGGGNNNGGNGSGGDSGGGGTGGGDNGDGNGGGSGNNGNGNTGGGGANPSSVIDLPPSANADVIAPMQQASGNVTLTLALDTAVENRSFKTGIPFPYGAVQSVDNLRIEALGPLSEPRTQFNTLASWPDGSLKSALVLVNGDFPAGQSQLRLNYGPGIANTPGNGPFAINESAQQFQVDTGLLRVTLSPSSGLMSSLHRDSNGDGSYSADEQILAGARIFLNNALDQRAYQAGTAVQITVEEEGPARAVIRVNGELVNGNNRHSKYTLRYYLYADSDVVDMDLTLVDDRLEHVFETTEDNQFALAVSAYGMAWEFAAGGAREYRFGGGNGAVHSGTVQQEHYLLQNGQLNHIDGDLQGYDFNYSGVATGERAAGWATSQSAAGGDAISVYFRDFWQQFPAELAVTADELRVSFFPERLGYDDTQQLQQQSGTAYRRANSFYFEREGGAKTYQLRLVASGDTPANSQLAADNELFQQHELPMRAPIDWYVNSGVFGELSAGGNPDAEGGYDAFLKQNVLVPSLENPGSGINMYGWRDFGDRMRGGWEDVENDVRVPAFYNDTHVGANTFFGEFIRTGDQAWFSIAEQATRHFMDIDVSHGPRHGRWSTPNTDAANAQPAGEIHAISHSMIDHETSRMHTGHAHISGLTNYYLLTGDYRALEVIHEIGGWWEYVGPYEFRHPFVFDDDAPGGAYREAERDYGWPLYVMNEYVRVTGDPDYHRRVSANLVQYMIDWWKTPAQRIGVNLNNGSIGPQGTNNAAQGTGWWTMTQMDNNNGFAGANGTHPWMAGSLLSNLIRFYILDQQFAAVDAHSFVDHGELKDMLFQTMNYVVKYGWEPELDDFVYSEAWRDDGGGFEHLVYPLAYLYRLHAQELQAGRIANPQWYDTVDWWKTIAESKYEYYREDKYNSQTLRFGFYGYEIVYPADYFRIMADGLPEG